VSTPGGRTGRFSFALFSTICANLAVSCAFPVRRAWKSELFRLKPQATRGFSQAREVHMAGSYRRRGWLSVVALGAATAAFPLMAEAGDERSSATLSKALNPGSVVVVTQWSGTKTQGEIIEVIDCALVLRVANEPLRVPIETIKSVAQHEPRKTNRAGGAMSGVAKYCGEAGCTRGSLMYMGAAVLIKAFQGGKRPPKVVYRATRAPDAAAAARPCPAASEPLDAANPFFLEPKPPV
jgi:hypothetical protein